MMDKASQIHDKRNFFQRSFGILLLEKCPKCHKYAFHAANYGEGGHCSVCGHTTERVKIEKKE